MEHTKIIKRAWQLLWSYRMLWVFGIILAFTTLSWPVTLMNNRDERNYDWGLNFVDGKGWTWQPLDFEREFEGIHQIPRDVIDFVVPVLIGTAIFLVVIFLIMPIFRYIAETALIRMVDAEEAAGERVNFRKGFRLGWSVGALRIFLLDLLVNAPFAVIVIGLLLVSAGPVMLFLDGAESGIVFGGILSAGLLSLVIFLAVVIWTGLSVLKRLARQYCVLSGAGVIEGIRQGYRLMRENISAVGLMWLIMAVVDLAWPILAIPLVLLGVVFGAVMGVSTGLLAGGIASATALKEPLQFAVGIIAGMPVFLLTMAIPVAILEGLKLTFQSSTWTLTYRELRSSTGLQERVEFA